MNAIRVATTAASLCILLAFVVMIGRYVALPGLLDHGEATICCDAKIWSDASPLYLAPDAPRRYSILYGPATFLIVATSLKIFGATIFAAKIPSAIAVVIGLVCCIAATRSIRITSIVALAWMCQRHFSYWIRPDPFEIACVGLALTAAINSKKSVAIVTMTIAMGIAVNLKLHAGFYFLPMLAILIDRFGSRPALSACALAIPVALAPFCLPNISLRNYLGYLMDASHHGFGVDQIERVAIWIALIFTAMLCAIRWNGRPMVGALRENGYFGFILSATMFVTGIFASKSGAGAHHLMPLFPLVGYFCAQQISSEPCHCISARILAFAGFAILLALLVPSLTLLWRQERSASVTKIESELLALMRSRPDAHFHMGWGGEENYRYTNARPILVFNHQPYFLDPLSVMDSQHAGRPLSRATTELLLAHSEITWLIPRADAGEAQPFTMTNPFDSQQQLAPEEFRRAFVEHFQRVGLTRHFELWVSSSAEGMTDN